ncbi:MAG: hypothetical protein COV34_00195 [Candidatus Zambryskibacteria bacterium CG10_big_fil_rev_8_21_14_0_10_42_12]|uniref:Type II secretion system protein GspI C-terminal domain-containing protein n=1 Tax=Candidatus Zambryskibacteria bacterium CG10_big_fil_rev_8_21_14_0_10_42_12 TaxID=1975115 RepID=A0A2H0QX59_9BACT|nr:MAG: hypothetical protein COV34_00195 [Candidatus Zambryskibacteria bacterium CG10_big_fil_rev_8_21_14_0_10_42_12]
MKKIYTHGFTVIEALVAIGILTVAISGAFAAASLSLNRSTYTKEQVTAFYLAQEGMEAIRWKRDTNAIAGNDWMEGIGEVGDPCLTPNVCYVDTIPLSMNFVSCGTSWGACPLIRLDSPYLYSYTAGTPTIFRREIQITPLTSVPYIADGNVVQVEVRVTWTHEGDDKAFIAKGLLYNWH